MESNCAVMINIAAKIGTLKNIPAMPHNTPQNTKFIKIANVDRFNVFPIIFGSKMFPNMISSVTNPTVVKNGKCNESPEINAYRIGNEHATIEPIVGI